MQRDWTSPAEDYLTTLTLHTHVIHYQLTVLEKEFDVSASITVSRKTKKTPSIKLNIFLRNSFQMEDENSPKHWLKKRCDTVLPLLSLTADLNFNNGFKLVSLLGLSYFQIRKQDSGFSKHCIFQLFSTIFEKTPWTAISKFEKVNLHSFFGLDNFCESSPSYDYNLFYSIDYEKFNLSNINSTINSSQALFKFCSKNYYNALFT